MIVWIVVLTIVYKTSNRTTELDIEEEGYDVVPKLKGFGEKDWGFTSLSR